MKLDDYLRAKIQSILTDWRNNDLSYAAAIARLSEYMSVESAVRLIENT